MTRINTLYELWLNDPAVDDQTKAELQAIADSPKEIEDRFYKDLEFGTGGLRGVMGAGTNRLNEYTIGKATQGLAQYVLAQAQANAQAEPSVVIAHDSRRNSKEFSLAAALVLAGNGIKAYLFEDLRPTPELSFAVRELGASAGIVVTASHNPPEYNGYKVYGPDGGQLTTEGAAEVTRQIQSIESFDAVKRVCRDDAEGRGLLTWIGEAVDRKFIDAVIATSQRPEVAKTMGENFRIVFTPLHGAGNLSVRNSLADAGFKAVQVVSQQELPDPMFSTVASPNPEERAAFTLALETAKEYNADLIIGTDPDCDRMGAIVKDKNGEYQILSGNQSGALMMNYILEAMKDRGELPTNGAVIKTIVTSDLGQAIAASYGVETLNTLTGFKYIGELMTEFAQTGSKTFIFGYEESYGYLAGMHARDKDAVVACLLISEAAAYYKSQGKTFVDVLNELYEKHGFYLEKLESRTMKGIEGVEKIRSIMEEWRTTPPAQIGGIAVSEVEDFLQGLYGLPRENVIKCKLADGSWICLRPSGTEPKIKFYFAVKGTTSIDANERLNAVVQWVMERIDN